MDGRTDGHTDGRTYGRTDTPSYRDARTHLKSGHRPTDGRTDEHTFLKRCEEESKNNAKKYPKKS